MEKYSIEIENDVFSCKQTDDVAFVTFKKNVIELVTNSEVRNAFFSTFSKIEASQKIKGVVITNSSKYTGDTNLKSFITHTIETLEYGEQNVAIQRFKNTMEQLANFFSNLTKPTVTALNGNIGEALFAVSLACDFRYATSNTIFHIQTVKLGLPTTGVLAFYLVNYVGLPRSIDILLTKTSLSAPEVHDLGLLTDVTADEELMSRCVEKLNDISQYPSYSISAMKRILRPDTNEISKLLDRAFGEFGLNLKEIKKALSDRK
jgi:2-(1,2-epoxy-1,2-dihydrophenyl)acetyl-CoA isomerase